MRVRPRTVVLSLLGLWGLAQGALWWVVRRILFPDLREAILADRASVGVLLGALSLGLGLLSSAGIVDVAGPILTRLAEATGELVRLSIVDEDRLTWVAKSQGTRQAGQRYDPDMGMDVRLSCTSSGHAWLMTMSDERAIALVSRQGFGPPSEYGPKAPTTIKALLGFLHAGRVRGYALIDEVFAPGMAAMAAPVVRRQEVIGIISIAGPRTRLSVERMHDIAPALLAAAAQLGPGSDGSGLFGKPALGKG